MENKGTHVENKGLYGAKNHVVVYDTRVKLNDALWKGKHNRHFIIREKWKKEINFCMKPWSEFNGSIKSQKCWDGAPKEQDNISNWFPQFPEVYTLLLK